jgi:DNA-directed RNA polymerase subunit RPC12/RpoP
MAYKKLLPACSRCHNPIKQSVIEKDRGDFIVRCEECNVRNILKLTVINKILVLTAEIIGWKD